MQIEWNRVTGLSQVVAIVLFLAVFAGGFLLGRKYENKVVLGEPRATAEFACANGSVIAAKFYERLVYISYPGFQNIYLPQTMSASGARYADKDESVIFWNKGDTARIEKNGEVLVEDCVAQ